MNKDKRLEQLREFTDAELRDEVVNTQQSLFKLRFGAQSEQNENTSGIKEKQKDLARIYTLMRARELKLEKQAGK